MSRNLLMSNLPENWGGVMPVTKGLICWLDGRDGRGQDTIWKDRSGNGNDAEIIGCEWTGYSLKINTRGVGVDEFLINNNNINGKYTIEVYFKSGDISKYNEAIKVITANNPKTYVKANSLYISNSKPYYLYGNADGCRLTAFNTNSPYHVAIVRENYWSKKFFINNELFIDPSSITNDNNQYVGNWGNGKMLGEYFSIRIYDRLLTEKEIQQNYLYEKSIQRGDD